MYLSNKRAEEGNLDKNLPPVIELLLPIETYWELKEQFKLLDFYLSSNDDPTAVSELTNKIIKKALPYAVYEKDRIFLKEKLNG
jgi:hypothetical protein